MVSGIASTPDELARLDFDNRFTRLLPADPESRNFRRQVQGACYSRVSPTPVAAPRMLAWSPEMSAALGLGGVDLNTAPIAEVFGGNRVLGAMDPYAMCYGGHQFGSWAGQLGDGRAINLGEVVTADGARWVLQLKGAGPTPYSRSADGLAVLRSSLREFVCSEAMHHLGIPTTRALTLVTSGQSVVRDMFYDGHPQREPGAVVCRVSPSFIRFGNFEIFTARGDIETLRRLVRYTINTDFPHLAVADDEALLPADVVRWFDQVCRLTAEMIVHWMRVGFVHGVMNTDNMSILGLTIDYGPYGWLEDYDPDWTPNTTDAQGRRYCFGNQPKIALWNLLQLANALVPLVNQTKPLEDCLQGYTTAFQHGWQEMIAAKLGWEAYRQPADESLVSDLLALLAEVETDMTLLFRRLADVSAASDGDAMPAGLYEAFYDTDRLQGDTLARWTRWLEAYRGRLRHASIDDHQRAAAMNAVNPIYVPRNYLAQLAIDAAEQGDASELRRWMETLRHPYDERRGLEAYAAKRPEWARHRAGCSMLSCSS